MWATTQDVREFQQELTSSIITDSQLEVFIFQATEVAKMHLYPMYTLTEMTATAYCGIPTPKDDNSGTVVLYGASAATTAYTELFTITCDDSSFSMTGNLQGQIASAVAYSSNFAGTDISLAASAWGGTPTSGDVYYVRTYDIYKPLVVITSMLAAGYALNSKYTEVIPNRSSMADKLIDKAEKWLEKLTDPNNINKGLAFDSTATYDKEIEPAPISYQIDEEGADVTKYYSDRGDRKGETLLEDD